MRIEEELNTSSGGSWWGKADVVKVSYYTSRASLSDMSGIKSDPSLSILLVGRLLMRGNWTEAHLLLASRNINKYTVGSMLILILNYIK